MRMSAQRRPENPAPMIPICKFEDIGWFRDLAMRFIYFTGEKMDIEK
jgi:hypothetical protein